jgi:hypothetical protein
MGRLQEMTSTFSAGFGADILPLDQGVKRLKRFSKAA